MPLSDEELEHAKNRVAEMFIMTLNSFRVIQENADVLFEENTEQIRKAIDEYFQDFIENTENSGMKHPRELIKRASKERFQNSGFYGVQLDMKERQVYEVNRRLTETLNNRVRRFFRKPFLKWVDVINNFLGSFISAVGAGEALKELKDCLRDELPS